MSIAVRRLTGTIGAEIEGVDLMRATDHDIELVKEAWHENMVVAIRGQQLSVEDLETFTQRVGPFGETPFITPLEGHPNVIKVAKEAHESINFGGAWHSDWSFQPEPPSATILYAIDVPEAGGDTAFANMAAAYDALSDEVRDEVDTLVAVHSAQLPYGSNGLYKDVNPAAMTITTSAEGDALQRHPLVRIHPVTGRRSLFVNPIYTVGLEEQDGSPVKGLLPQLYSLATQIELTCRVRWEPGTLTMWDNRTVMHYAVNDYAGQRRELIRTTVAGDRPVGLFEVAS